MLDAVTSRRWAAGLLRVGLAFETIGCQGLAELRKCCITAKPSDIAGELELHSSFTIVHVTRKIVMHICLHQIYLVYL